MVKFFKGLFVGLLLGAISAVVLYVLGFALEILNCACNIVRCNFRGGDILPFMWNWESFKNCMIFTTGGGTLIGSITGLVMALQEKSKNQALLKKQQEELALKQRQENAHELKLEIAGKYAEICSLRDEVYRYQLDFECNSSNILKKAYGDLSKSYMMNSELNDIIKK